MIYKQQTVAVSVCTDADGSTAGSLKLAGLTLAAPRIRAVGIVGLNVFHGGESEVLIRYLTADDDASEAALLRNLDLETENVTIISRSAAAVRTLLRLRAVWLLDLRRGGAETVHRQVSSARWSEACGTRTAVPHAGVISPREERCLAAAMMLLDELGLAAKTPFGMARFERTATLLKSSAEAAGLGSLAGHVDDMRLAALQH